MSCATTFLDASGRLDNIIERALSILQPFPPDSDQFKDLRLILHRLTIDMTDHLASATSQLTDLVDKDELAVLNDMYDIPSTASSSSRRPGRSGTEEEDDLVFNMTESWKTSSVPSPRQPRLSLSPQGPSPTYSTFPIPHSQSVPSVHRKPRHLYPLQSSPLARLSQPNSPEDRFTSLPSRTPRSHKRMSWGPENSPMNRLDVLAPALTIRSRRMSRNSPNSKWTEHDDDAQDDGSSCDSRRTSWSEHHVLGSGRPVSPNPLTANNYTPVRPTVADTQLGHGRTMSHSPNTPVTPNPPNPKRLSLQNMPYYRSSGDEDSSPEHLVRTRARPQSDIQTLRSRNATGSRQSLNTARPTSDALDRTSPMTVLTSPTPPPIRRMVSISPLTLHSLKASCLGIHLRRRRVACCLLGLRFDVEGGEYWREVAAIMRILTVDIEAELAKLDDAVTSALEESPSISDDVDLDRAPWKSTNDAAMPVASSSGVADFAPRTSDEAALAERIDGLRKTLEKTWADLATVRRLSDVQELEHKWSTVRGDLGELVREWERGKDVVGRMTSTAKPPHPGPSSPSSPQTGRGSTPDALPQFMRHWTQETDESPSTSFETDVQPASLDSQDDDDAEQGSMSEKLPRPGLDVVFEADLSTAARVRERSALSREERIALSKMAREEGLSLNDLLKRQAGEEVMSKGDHGDIVEQGGMVVDELKTMIGMIRARKGVDEENKDITPTTDNHEKPVPIPSPSKPKQQTDNFTTAKNITVGNERNVENDLEWRKDFVLPPFAPACAANQ